MCDIEVPIHPLIQRFIQVYYKFGMWQDNDANWYRKIGRILVFLFGSIGFTSSLIGGSLIARDYNESLYLLTAGIIVAVLIFKTYLIYSKGSQFVTVLHKVCVHSVPNSGKLLEHINRKMNLFEKCTMFFLGIVCLIVFIFLVLFCPLLTSERKLPFNIWFPIDWRTHALAHWLAYSYIIFCLSFNAFVCLLTLMIWYVMLNCSILYQTVGQRFKNLGTVQTGENAFINELQKLLNVHQIVEVYAMNRIDLIGNFNWSLLTRDTTGMKNLLSSLFFAQIGTSAICICGSVYAATTVRKYCTRILQNSHFFIIVFIPVQNRTASIDQLIINLSLSLYCIFDIFVLAYLGNEIKDSSSKLSHCLFECNWVGQTESCKSRILILMALLQQPREIIIGKLYPLNLQTFTAVSNTKKLIRKFAKFFYDLRLLCETDFTRSLQHAQHFEKCLNCATSFNYSISFRHMDSNQRCMHPKFIQFRFQQALKCKLYFSTMERIFCLFIAKPPTKSRNSSLTSVNKSLNDLKNYFPVKSHPIK